MTRILPVLALAQMVSASVMGASPSEPFATAHNPQPDKIPSLWVYENEEKLLMVAARFPDAPDFTCESWCYESDADFLDARALDGGRLELRHRERRRPQVVYVTAVSPEPGAVEFCARATLDPVQSSDTASKLPDDLLGLNLCWQLRKAPGFASKPEPYPELIKRCFIFSDEGRVFLHNTPRHLIPCRKTDDPYNNPPWVQSYVGVWRSIPPVQPTSWADYSDARYVAPIIGAVSRDAKHLAALANDSADTMCQAWHDCLHNNPAWVPAGGPPEARTWRVKVYVMANDPGPLVARVVKDFPNAQSLAKNRVPAR